MQFRIKSQSLAAGALPLPLLVPMLLPILLALLLLAPRPADAEVFAVEARPLSEVLVDLERRAPAEVLALNDTVIAAEVNAVVAEIAADVGQQVERGALLVALDPRDFELEVEAAEAALASATAQQAEAQAKLERAQRLGQAQYISEDELLGRQTALSVSAAAIRTAKAQLAIARRQLEKTRINAPFAGVLRERSAQQGAFVTVGTPLVRLTQTDPVELAAELPAGQVDTLERADELFFTAAGQQWPVQLLRLSPVLEPGRRSQRARFAFSGRAAPAGQNGELVWRVAEGQLPSNLISRRAGQLGVFTVDGSVARFHPLPLAEEGRPATVELPADTLIVVRGQDRLQDGVAVQRP